MKAEEIREGDIVEIDYITEFTKEHINEGKALVIWKGFNNQPLVRKLDTKKAIWTCYEHIARVVGHIDIAGYMDRALSAEPCDDCISRQAVLDVLKKHWLSGTVAYGIIDEIGLSINALPSVTPKEKTGKWEMVGMLGGDVTYYRCSECNELFWIENGTPKDNKYNYCPNCGARMVSE